MRLSLIKLTALLCCTLSWVCQSTITANDTLVGQLRDTLAQWPEEPSDQELNNLRLLDQQLLREQVRVDDLLLADALAKLALSQEARSLEYLHTQFESYPERRHLVAAAWCRATMRKRRSVDWPQLVRSLPNVEGNFARELLETFPLYQERATKPKWIRQVIVLGLQLDEAGQRAALQTLEHWTGQQLAAAEVNATTRLSAYQRWFGERYADEYPATVPVDAPNAKWQYRELVAQVYRPDQQGNAARGRAVFDKAQCSKCHRVGTHGETLGPSLSDTPIRFTRRELIRSCLFPSDTVSDQYESYTVVTRDGRSFTGLVGPAGDGGLTILQLNGEKAAVKRGEVEQSVRNTTSAMPQNLLDNLNLAEIADLLAYLLAGGEVK